MELNSFRIIAVRVFSYCDPAIMRALYPETTYFLKNDYEDVYEGWHSQSDESELRPAAHPFVSANGAEV